MALPEQIKFNVDLDMADRLRRRANLAGCSTAEFMRDVVYMLEHGVTYGEFVAKHRRGLLRVEAHVPAQEKTE